MRAKIGIFFLLPLLSACIGVDYQDDPVVDERIEILSSHQLALVPGEMKAIEVSYFDRYGVEQDVMFTWTSSNTNVVTVNDDGLVTAVAQGQAVVQASYGLTASPPVSVNVVLGPNDVAYVEILQPLKTVLEIGEEVTLIVKAKNILNEELDLAGKTIEWFSENASILTVSTDGTVTALESGVAGIHAKVNSVKSNSVNFTVGSTRTGTFVSAGGYKATGIATLKQETNKLILQFSNDFDTDFALGTFIYLANTTSGADVRSKGLEIQQISMDGAHTFDVTAINSNVALHDYRYVIVLCKPASVTFGYADLN